MGRHGHKRAGHRRAIADEAARIIADSGVRDFYQAKIKAAQRLGVARDGDLPRNADIVEALRDRLQLFDDDGYRENLRQLRKVAVDSMRFLAEFSPRLTGPVLDGTADAHCPVSLHVFAESTEQLALFLVNRNIPFDQEDRQIRLDRKRQGQVPVFLFEAGETAVELLVFSPRMRRQAPLSPIDGKAMKRASLSAVEQLLRADESTPQLPSADSLAG